MTLYKLCRIGIVSEIELARLVEYLGDLLDGPYDDDRHCICTRKRYKKHHNRYDDTYVPDPVHRCENIIFIRRDDKYLIFVRDRVTRVLVCTLIVVSCYTVFRNRPRLKL